MFKIINVFEIISDYFADMKKDLKPLPLVIDLLAIPLVIACILYFLITDIKKFANVLITITSIFVPLLLNILIIVHYSIERTVKGSKTNFLNYKLEFLKHINTTTSMVIFISIFILFVSVIITNVNTSIVPMSLLGLSLRIGVKFSLMFLVGFMFVNIIITLLRVYRLINFEIKEYNKEDKGDNYE